MHSSLGALQKQVAEKQASIQLSFFHQHLVETQVATYRRYTASFPSYLGSSEVRSRVNSGERSCTQGGRQLAGGCRT